jgi:hypothetical protein
LHPIPLSDGTTLLRMRRRYPRAEKWGLFAFADPSRPAYQSFVLWLPTASRRMVRARCTMVRSDAAANVMMLATFRAKRFATIGVDGVSVVTLKGDGSCVSLIACGWQALTRPVVVTFELDGFDELGVRIECLRTLQRLADPGSSTPAAPAPTAANERLRQALLALDASLSGASYRQIATTIFGEERVSEDWNAASRFLKDRIRRLVAKGHALMDGGYRDLLR